MPSIPATWFERNFGKAPTGFGQEQQYDMLGRPIPQLRQFTPYQAPGQPGLFSQYSDEVVQGWEDANQAARVASAGRPALSTAARMEQARQRDAQLRARLRQQLTDMRVKVTEDLARLRTPDAKQAAAGQPMITLPGVKEDLGRLQSSVDPFPTGRWETKSEAMYARPITRDEKILDVGRQTGVEVTRSPIVAYPQYRDSQGTAQRYAQINRLDAQGVKSWQNFFVRRGLLQAGSFIMGAWDANTQKAMYQQMGEANAMGQKVENVRGMWEQNMKTLGWDATTGYPTSSGAGAQARDVTQKVFSITSLAKGGELLRTYLQQELGRDPSRAEIAAYVRLLNGKERKNPTITRTHYSASGDSSTSVVKEANVDPGDTANKFVTTDLEKELGARQTMEYMDILAGM
jgi:hypothetical protein